MNRLSPLIARQVRHPERQYAEWKAPAFDAPKSSAMDDLQLFLTGWAGGLVFFGTLLL
jgi:hypothetical protein